MSWERDREKGYETQFARQEETAFKAAAHRNRRLAEWAAQRMGLRHHDTSAYIKTLVTDDVAHLRGRTIIDKVVRDLRAAGVTVTEGEVAAVFDRLDTQAREDLARE